jgi:hypothetical protein
MFDWAKRFGYAETPKLFSTKKAYDQYERASADEKVTILRNWVEKINKHKGELYAAKIKLQKTEQADLDKDQADIDLSSNILVVLDSPFLTADEKLEYFSAVCGQFWHKENNLKVTSLEEPPKEWSSFKKELYEYYRVKKGPAIINANSQRTQGSASDTELAPLHAETLKELEQTAGYYSKKVLYQPQTIEEFITKYFSPESQKNSKSVPKLRAIHQNEKYLDRVAHDELFALFNELEQLLKESKEGLGWGEVQSRIEEVDTESAQLEKKFSDKTDKSYLEQRKALDDRREQLERVRIKILHPDRLESGETKKSPVMLEADEKLKQLKAEQASKIKEKIKAKHDEIEQKINSLTLYSKDEAVKRSDPNILQLVINNVEKRLVVSAPQLDDPRRNELLQHYEVNKQKITDALEKLATISGDNSNAEVLIPNEIRHELEYALAGFSVAYNRPFEKKIVATDSEDETIAIEEDEKPGYIAGKCSEFANKAVTCIEMITPEVLKKYDAAKKTAQTLQS